MNDFPISTPLLIGIIVVVLVILIVLIVAGVLSSKRRKARQQEEDRRRAAELREQAQKDEKSVKQRDLTAKESELEADRAGLQADQKATEAEEEQLAAERRRAQAEEQRSAVEEDRSDVQQSRDEADRLDPDTPDDGRGPVGVDEDGSAASTRRDDREGREKEGSGSGAATAGAAGAAGVGGGAAAASAHGRDDEHGKDQGSRGEQSSTRDAAQEPGAGKDHAATDEAPAHRGEAAETPRDEAARAGTAAPQDAHGGSHRDDQGVSPQDGPPADQRTTGEHAGDRPVGQEHASRGDATGAHEDATVAQDAGARQDSGAPQDESHDARGDEGRRGTGSGAATAGVAGAAGVGTGAAAASAHGNDDRAQTDTDRERRGSQDLGTEGSTPRDETDSATVTEEPLDEETLQDRVAHGEEETAQDPRNQDTGARPDTGDPARDGDAPQHEGHDARGDEDRRGTGSGAAAAGVAGAAGVGTGAAAASAHGNDDREQTDTDRERRGSQDLATDRSAPQGDAGTATPVHDTTERPDQTDGATITEDPLDEEALDARVAHGEAGTEQDHRIQDTGRPVQRSSDPGSAVGGDAATGAGTAAPEQPFDQERRTGEVSREEDIVGSPGVPVSGDTAGSPQDGDARPLGTDRSSGTQDPAPGTARTEPAGQTRPGPEVGPAGGYSQTAQTGTSPYGEGQYGAEPYEFQQDGYEQRLEGEEEGQPGSEEPLTDESGDLAPRPPEFRAPGDGTAEGGTPEDGPEPRR